MKVAYVIQNPAINLADGKGTELHVRGVLTGIQSRASHVRLVELQGRNRTVRVTDLSNNHNLNTEPVLTQVQLGVTGTKPFMLLESAIRRLQTELNTPYFSFWDSLRLYEGCYRALGGYDILHAHFDLIPLGTTLASRKLNIPLILDC